MAQFTKTTDKQLMFYDAVDRTIYQLTPGGTLLQQDLNSVDAFNLDLAAWSPTPDAFLRDNACFCKAIVAVLNNEEGAQHPGDVIELSTD